MSPESVTQILGRDAVRLGLTARNRDDAIRQCGEVLVEIGAAGPEYAVALHEREASISTYLGEGVAIPHGTDSSRVHINRPALAFLQFPEGVDWNGNTCQVAIAIASRTDEHIGILQSLALVLSDSEAARRLRETTEVDEVLRLLAEDDDEEETD